MQRAGFPDEWPLLRARVTMLYCSSAKPLTESSL